MDILIFEDPNEHGGRTVAVDFASRVKLHGKTEIVTTLIEAYQAMKHYDAAIIHHHSFQALDHLRKRFPEKKFYAYSGAAFTGGNVESLMNGFDAKLQERYDRLIYGTTCIDEIMTK